MESNTRRKFIRLKTRQAARVHFAGGATVDCEIRDFCPTGFFLRVSRGDAGTSVGASLMDASVTVAFSGAPARAPQRHTVEGRVAHCSDQGIGVFAGGMAETAFQALLDHRAGLYRTDAGTRPGELDAADLRTVRLQCQSLYRPFLSRVIDELFSLVNGGDTDDLRIDAGFDEASDLHALMAVLRHSRADIEQRFTAAALERVEGDRTPDAAAPAAGQSLELSLVDDGEFDDWLNLSAVISKAESGLQKPLGQFESLYRLASIRAGAESAGEAGESGRAQSSPFGPDALCRAFQEAIQDLPIDNGLRAGLYRLFGRAFMVNAPGFYESLGKLAAVAERRRDRSEAVHRDDAGLLSTGRVAAAREPGPGIDGLPDSPVRDGRAYSLERSLAALNGGGLDAAAGPVRESGGAIPEAIPEAIPDAIPDAIPVDTSATAVAAGSLIRTASLLQQVVSELADRMAVPASPDVLTLTEAGPRRPEADAQELLRGLSQVLQARRSAPAATAHPSLTEQLQARLAATDGDGRTLASRDQQILDSLARLFDRAMAEYAPGSQLESLMRRFEEPFYRLALRDPAFLASDQHPARQLLDVLDQFAIATDDQGRFFDARLFEVLGTLLDNVIARPEQSAESFLKCGQALRKMLVPLQRERRQRVLRLQEASEGRHRIQQSRIRVLAELESRLGGRRAPRLLLRLLDQGWRHYLCLLELRQGRQGEDWLAGIGVVDTLLVWLAPEFRPGPGFSAAAATLLRSVRSGLAGVSVEPQAVDTMLDELDSALMARLDEPGRDVESVAVEPGRILGAHEADGAGSAEDLEFAERLVLGSWWNIAPDGGRPTAQQLIWLSQPAGRCAFANRSATKKQELALAELARLQASGRAEADSDKALPVLERSEGSLVDSVYRQVAQQSRRDPVTGLINRRSLLQTLAGLPAQPVGTARPHTLGIVEFDQLRVISHLHGVDAREALLRQLAAEFEQRMQPDAVLAACGDDTFGVWLSRCDASEARQRFVAAITWLKGFRYARAGASFGIAASVGIAEFDPGTVDANEILRRADAACMSASNLGRNQVQVYSSGDARVQGQESLLAWAGSIDTILAENRLFLRCQRVSPVAPADGRAPYHEILLGVRAPDGAVAGPLPLIQAAERWNRAHDIDRWVLEQVFGWIRLHPDAFVAMGGFSINLSTQSLQNDDILALLHRELAVLEVPASKLMFEITETTSVGSYPAARDFVRQIRRYGCRFCIDDFGSGYASYGHLKNLQADVLKIDGVFVRDMLASPADRAMVRSMKEIGHSLGMTVVAEYVETDAHLVAVRDVGVDYAQGYALHEPAPIDELVPATFILTPRDASRPVASDLQRPAPSH